MSNIDNVVQNLYEKFVLRDILSFITPGSILLLGIFIAHSDLVTLVNYSKAIHWILYIPIFGLFFLTGFIIQTLGELFGLRFTPTDDNSSWKCRRKIFTCNWKSCNWWKESHNKMKIFNETINDSKHQYSSPHQRYERFAVIKQMLVNNIIAIILTFFYVLSRINPWFNLSIIILYSLSTFLSMFWGYRVYMLKQEDWRSLHSND